MKGCVYKIRHIESGLFVRVKLSKIGIAEWKEKNVISGNPEFGKVLYKTHKGWNKRPKPSNDDFNEIGCEIVKYILNYTEIKK